MPQTRAHMAILDTLTDKQQEVLSFVSDGLTSKEIARKLNISVSAVNQRIEMIRHRLGGLPRSQIARLYRRQSTVMLTIPASNSLTGKPIALQASASLDQAGFVEGVVGPVELNARQYSGVLQPSTISRKLVTALAGPERYWWRTAAIVTLAAAIAITALLALSVAQTLDGLVGS